MSVLRASLFQTLRVESGDGLVLDLGSPTTRSLFTYLLLKRDRPSDRRRLAFLFWPRGTESAARRNLRQYLHRVRRALEPLDFEGEFILTTGSTVQINPAADIWVDVEAFRQATRPDAALEELRDAVPLYTGDLLEDLYDDWCASERDNLRSLFISALERLTQATLLGGNLEQAIGFTQKRIAIDPLDEAAHRDLMQLFALNQDRNRALQQYNILCEILEDELNAEVLPETRALYEAIQRGSFRPGQPGLAVTTEVPASKRLTQARPAPLPIVGRSAELELLKSAFQRAQDKSGHLILITGQSGIGKTRLVQEYLSEHESHAIQATCHELEARTPFAPLRQAIQKSMALMPEIQHSPPSWLIPIAPLIPSLAERFSYLPGANTAPPENSRRTMEAFTNLILGLSTRTEEPLHLIIDNLHWADSQTWDFLIHLAHRLKTISLLVIGLCRLEDLPAEQHHALRVMERDAILQHVALNPLSERDTRALASHILDDSRLGDSFYQRLFNDTGGNPFFVIETVRALVEAGGKPEFSQGRLHHGLPAGVQRVIEARLERLSAQSLELLATAAAIGRDFTFSLLEETSLRPDKEIIAALEEWGQRGLVIEVNHGYDFSHDNIRQVAYNSLGRARRQFIHRQIGQILENSIPGEDAATLAHHFALSDRPLKALPYLTQAGQQALRVRSYQEARHLGRQAINLMGRIPGPSKKTERVDVNLQLAQAFAFSGDLNRALEILTQAERLATSLGDESRLGNIFYRSSILFWLRGRPDTAGDYARRALRLSEELENENLRFAALRMLGRTGIATSQYDDAITYLLRYIDLCKKGLPQADLPVIYGYLGVAYARVGSWRRAVAAAETGLELAAVERAGETEVVARMQLAFVYGELFEWDRVLQVTDPIRDAWQEGGMSPHLFMLRAVRGRALVHLGETKTGLDEIQAAMDWAEIEDYRVMVYLPTLFMAECLLKTGSVGAAFKPAEQAGETAEQAGDPWAQAVALHLQARIEMRQPNPAWREIESRLTQAASTLRKIRSRPELARTYLSLRRLYDRAGQIAWAVDCHFRATTIFEELGMTTELYIAQGHPAGDRTGAVVIPGLDLRGPNVGISDAAALA